MINFVRIFTIISLFLYLNNAISQNTTYVPGEILIQINPSEKPEDVSRYIHAATFEEIKSFTCISDVMNIWQVQFVNTNCDINEILRKIKGGFGILAAQKNHYVYERETIPSDTLFDNQWHHKNTGQTGGLIDADIDSPEAWDITTGGLTTHGDTIVVCIIEGNGVDLNHIDLKDNIWKNYAEIPNDGIDNDNNGYIDDYLGWHVINLDDNIGAGSHGTRVAGMIGAAGNNVTGVSGVNWNVKMMVVQGQQVSNESSVIAAYTYPLKMRKRYNETYGQEGAFVVATNSSWGIDNADASDSPLWCAMYDSLGYYGILNIAATTNNNSNVDVVGDMPTTCTSEFLVAVTMTNSQDLRANSGYGLTHVDIGAPGSSVQTTSPGNVYTISSGTSFATPCVAGCVALAYSAPCNDFMNYVKYDPSGATLDMRQYMLESVDETAGLLTEVSSGGRVNVKSYIDSLLSACDPNTCDAPYNIQLTSISDTSAAFEWEGFSTDYAVWFAINGSALTSVSVSGSNTFMVDTLQACSYYTMYVQGICGTDSSNLSYPVIFQTDGCCNNPALDVSSKTNTSISIIWPDILSATSYDIRYKLSDESAWTEVLNVSSPFDLTGLNPCAEYEFQIHTQCADSTQGYSNSLLVTTLGCGACTEQTYCDVQGANANTEWIAGISINTFSNNTGSDGGWLVSNQIITALTPGNSYNITFTPGYSGFNFTEGFSVWIDFDGDGDFETTELLINNLTSNTSITGILTIPSGASIGVKKMRIGMSATAAPETCPVSGFYGEYEDYCVYIGPQAGIEENSIQIELFPNPADNEIYLQSNTPVLRVELIDYTGKIVLISDISNTNSITVDKLSSGIYLVKIYSLEGAYTTKFVKQ